MRILIVTESFAPAGDAAADTARHITDALLAAGHQVLVVAPGPGNGSYRGARVYRYRTLFSPTALRRAVREFGPELIQFLAPRGQGAAAMRSLEGLAIPTVVLDPTPLHPRTGTVLASTSSGTRVLAAAGIESRLWRPGVRTDEHHPGLRSAALHDRWARATSPEGPLTVVGAVGTVGHPTSKAVRRLTRIAALDGVRLVVLGTGPGTPALKEAGAKIVGDCTGLELARAIASLDVLVQPRKQNGAPAPIGKALASNVPVVAFDTGVAADVVQHGRTGLLVKARTGTTGLVSAVERLSTDTALRHRLAANGRASVADRTWSDAVAELVGIYEPLHLAV